MAINKASNLTSDVISQLNSGKISAEEAGWYLSNGFAVGINKGVGNAVAKAAYLAQAAIDEVRRQAQIQSPSKVMKQIGLYFDEGLGLGIEKGQKDVLNTVNRFSSDILDGFDDMYMEMQKTVDLETSKMSANVKTSGTYQIAMNSTPTFNLRDNSTNRTELVVDGRKLAEVVNTQNRSREVAKA